MILGADAIIIHVDDVRKLVEAFLVGRSKQDLKRLQERGLLDLLDEMRQMVREYEIALEVS